MQEILTEKLHNYIIANNLDLLIELQQDSKEDSYLQEKVATVEALLNQLLSDDTPSYIIEEQCLDFLTKDLRPSRFNYLLTVLEEDFEKQTQHIRMQFAQLKKDFSHN